MPEKSPGHLDTDRMTLEGAIDAFLLSRRVGNATRQTLDYYDTCLSRFAGIVKHPLQPTTSRDDLRITEPPSPPLSAITPPLVEQYLDFLGQRRHIIV